MTPDSFIIAHAAHSDWRIALAQSQSQIQARVAARAAQHAGSPPLTLGWCYLSDHYAPAAEAILAELRKHLPGLAWVGTAGVGVAAGGTEYIDEPALVLMAAPLPRGSFRLYSGRQPLPARGSDFVAHTALVHADGSTPDLQELLQELAARTATGYLFGGLSSSRNRMLHIADAVLTGGLSGVAFGPEVGLVSRVTQGCQPIGPARTITSGECNYLGALDGRPALDCVLQDLGLADGEIEEEELLEALSATLVGLSRGSEDAPVRPGQFGTETVVRHIVGVDRDQRVLAVADDVEPGTRLSFCRRDARAARADLARIATEIRDELGGDARRMLGALYVSCSGRGGPHFGARNAELQTVREALGDVPLAGFFAGGEIARDRLYGYTGVLTVFAQAR